MSQLRTVNCQDDGGVMFEFKSSVTVALLPDGKNVSVKVADKNTQASVEIDANLFNAMCDSFVRNVKPQIGTPSND